MRKTLFYILFLSLAISSFGQKEKVKNNPAYDDKPLHFGYSLGIDAMDFYIDRNYLATPADTLFADMSELGFGFHINIISDFRLAEYLNIRCLPGVAFGQRDISFYSNNGKTLSKVVSVGSEFLEIPISLKYKAKRINNYRPYLIGGLCPRYDMAFIGKLIRKNREEIITLKQFDLNYEIGFGIDYYLEFFKLSTELKLSIGTRDIFNADAKSDEPEYGKAIDKLTSNIVVFSVHFE